MPALVDQNVLMYYPPWRLKVHSMASHRYYDYVVFCLIAVNCGTIAAVNFDSTVGLDGTFDTVNGILTFAFVFEMTLKVIGFGVKGFIRQPWNVFDLIVVIAGLIGFIVEIGTPSDVNSPFTRTIRILRLIRILSVSEKLRILVTALISSSRSLLHVVILMSFFILLASDIALDFFKGSFQHRCHPIEYALEVVNGTRQIHVQNDEANGAPVCRYSALSDEYFHRANLFFSADTSNATELHQFVDAATTKLIHDNNYDARFQRYGLDLGFVVRNKTELPFVIVAAEDDEFMCRYGELCIIAQTPQYGKTNFDTVASTVSLIYDLMSSLDGWSFIIYFLSMGQGWWVATLYFGFILTVGNFFLLNLTLVVILDAFNRSQTLTSMVEDAVLETTTQMDFTFQKDDAGSSHKGSEPTTLGSPDSASGSTAHSHSYQKALLADPSPSPNLKQTQGEDFPLRRHQRASVSFGDKYEDYVRSKVNDETASSRKRTNTVKSKVGFFSNQFQRQLSAAFGASHDIDNMDDAPSQRESEGEEMSDSPAVPLIESTSTRMLDIAYLEDSHEKRVHKSQDDELTAAKNARTTYIEERNADEEPYQRPAVVGAYTLLDEYESDASNTERQSGRRGHIVKPSLTALTLENVMCCLPCCSTTMCPPLVGRVVALLLVTRRLVRNYLVARLWFRVLTGVMLVLNLAIESTAYAGMTQDHRDFIDGANILFTLFYVIEVVSKLIAYPFFVFRRDMFNFFDLGVTLASSIELVTTNGGETFGALRSLRLLRLVSIIEPFRITMATLISAFRGAVSLLVLVFLFIFLFAVMGMQIFAGNYCGLDSDSPYRVNTTFCNDVPRYNFDNVGYAFQTIFSVVSSEGWRDMMVVAEASTSPYASLFFCIAHFTVGYLVLNLFVAVMLNSCTEVQMVSYALNAMMRRSEGTKDGRTRFFKIKKSDMGLLDDEAIKKRKKRNRKTSSRSNKSKRSSQSGACSSGDGGVLVTNHTGLSALGGNVTVIKRAMGSSADTNSPKWDSAATVAGTEKGISVARADVPAFELASDEASATHIRDDAIANDLFDDLYLPQIKRRNNEYQEYLDKNDFSTSEDFSSTGSNESEAGVFEDEGQAEEDVVREFMFSAVSRRNFNQAPKSRRWMKQDGENLDDHLLRTNANPDESLHLAGVSQRRVVESSVARLTSNDATEQPPVITRDSFPLFSRILLRLRESAAFVYTSHITLSVIIATTLLSMAYQTVWSPVLHPYHPILITGQAIDVIVAAVYLCQTAVKMLYFGFKTDDGEEEVVVVSASVPLYAPPASEATASAPPKVEEAIDEDVPVIEDFSPFIFPTKSYFNSHWHMFELFVTIAATIPLIVHSVWAHSITYNYRTSGLATSCSSCIIWCRLLRNLHVWTFVRYYPPANLLFRSLIRSIRGLRNAFAITILIWYIYAVLGLQLFGDKMSACTTNPHTLDAGADGNWGDASYAYPFIEDKATCISAGYYWRTKPQNFDNVGEALVTVFNIATVSNWHFTMYTATDVRGRDISPKQNSTVWAPLYFMSVIVIVAYFLINFFKASLIESFFSTKAAIEAKFLEIRVAREAAADVIRQRRNESLRVAKRRLAKLQEEDGDKIDFELNIVNWDDGSGATTKTLTKRQKVKRHLASKIKSIVAHLTESNVADQTTIVNSKCSGEIRVALDKETAAAGNFVLMLTEDERYFFDMYKFALYFVRPPLVVEYTRNSSRIRFYLRTALRSKYADFSTFILAALHLFLEMTQFWTNPIMTYPGYANMDMAFTMVFVAIMIGKMIVYGVSAYFDTTSNKLDCVVNILTLAGAIMGISHDDAYFWRSTRILLFFRFIRMHHILNVSRQLAVQLRMFVDSSQSFLSVFVLLFIYVFTAAHMAMNFFGRVKWTDFDGLNQWSTFSRFDRAMYTLVRIGTTDNWNHIMHNCQLEAPLCDPNIGECGSSILSPFFFLIYLSLANWIGLNFFTAVLMDGFVKSDSDEKFPIQQDHVRHFQRQWKKLARRDPTRHTLTFNELIVFMCLLPAKPLGLSGPLKNFKGTIGVRRARCSIQEQIATTMSKENMPFGKLQQSAQKRAKSDAGEESEGAVGDSTGPTPKGTPTTASSPGEIPKIQINTQTEAKEIHDENLPVGAVTVLRLLLNLTYVPLFLYGPGSPSSLPESDGVILQTATKKELHPNESNFALGQYYCFPGDVFDGLARLHYGSKLPKVAEKVLLRERYKSFKREETEATMERVSTVSHFSESSKPADEAAQKEFDAVVQRMRARHGDDKVMPGKNREFFVTSVGVMAACVIIQRCWRRHATHSSKADGSK